MNDQRASPTRARFRLDVAAYADGVEPEQKRQKGPYRRRYGVIWRPASRGGRPWVNDGGEDEPLSPRGRVVYLGVALGIVVVFVVLAILTAHGF